MLPTTQVAMAGALLSLASPATADMDLFSDINAFEALANSSGGFPSQSFRSSPIIAPIFQVNAWNPQHADPAPYIFLGTVYGGGNGGPMIFDARDLSLVYADQQYENMYSSSVQEMDGQRYLTFWAGEHHRGHASGDCFMFDEAYELKYKVTAHGGVGEGTLADMHEMFVTHDGNVVFSRYTNIDYDCSSVNGPKEALLMDSTFQEVDPKTDEVIFDWAASDHFDITDTFAIYNENYGVSETTGFDFFHINSIEKTLDGNYLISGRHVSVITLISGKTGKPIWILGGPHNQFTDLSNGSATNFSWQHNPRFHQNQTQITLFDNHGEWTHPCDGNGCDSRGLHLEIDTEAMTARVLYEYFHPQAVESGAMGGMQLLDSGNVMIGWGYNPGFVEYTQDGEVIMDVQRGNLGAGFLNDMFVYRVSKQNWVGKPKWPPAMAVDVSDGTTNNGTAYVSWNGATEVVSWAIFASNNISTINNPLNLLTTQNRTGFETAVNLPATNPARYIAAAAVSSSGAVLGSTSIFDMSNAQDIATPSNITSLSTVKALSVTKASGVVGGAVFAFAALFYAVNYWWNRRAGKGGEALYVKVEEKDQDEDEAGERV